VPKSRNAREAILPSPPPHLRRDSRRTGERATEAAATADLAAPVLPALSTMTRTLELPGIAPKGATVPIPDILQATIRGRPTAAGVDTKEAAVTAEAEAMAENAAAATSWEGSPAEAGVGPGTAGRAVPHSTWKPASRFISLQSGLLSYLFALYIMSLIFFLLS
jgi:hypothetical protein